MTKNKINLIYLAGVSYSGSTLLGLMMGSSPAIENVGELKKFHTCIVKRCSCGAGYDDCPFWKNFSEDDYRIYSQPSFLKKILLLLAIWLKIKVRKNTISQNDDIKILRHLEKDFYQKNKQFQYILDTSKSIWRLWYLLKCQGIEIKVIYLKKNLAPNVASYTKRSFFGFWIGLLAYQLNHYFIPRFLKVNQLPFVEIQYEEYCASPTDNLQKIGDFLGLTFDTNIVETINQQEFHLRTGNIGTVNQIRQKLEGVKEYKGWRKHLSPFQLFLLKRTFIHKKQD